MLSVDVKRMRIGSMLLAFVVACSFVTGGAGARERVSDAGEVLVVLDESFLNALLVAVASQKEPPSFPLSKEGGNEKCPSRVQLLREAAGERTGVRFADGQINAPVAFRGSYAAPLLGCLSFEGWADAFFQLEFDRERQVLNARVTVRDLKLKNVPMSLVGGGLTGLVQDAIDARVNPVQILRAEQLSARVPITRDSQLNLRARDVRHEIAGKELRLHIVYELVQPD